MEKKDTDTKPQADTQSVLADKQMFGGEAAEKLQQMGGSSSEAREKPAQPSQR
jgi:hypothetical protein